MKKQCMLLCAALLSVFIFAAGTKDSSAKEKKGAELSVVTTIFPVFDFTRAVMYGGTDAQTGKVSGHILEKVRTDNAPKLLVKPGMEIHSFDPSPADIAAIQKADVFIYNGGDSDEWVEDILKSVDTNGKLILRLTDYVDIVEEEIIEGMEHSHEGDDHDHEHCDGTCEDHDHDHSHEIDEHIWTSPANAVKIVNAIRDALIKADALKCGGMNAESFTKNAEAYNALIQSTAEKIASVVAGASDKFILMGDRFPLRYFVDYYGLEYRAAFSGCSTAVEANAATIAFLIDKAGERAVPAVFAMEMSNRKIAQTVAEGVAKKGGVKPEVLELHTVHNVTNDDFKAGETWVSLMLRNAESLKKGLK